MIKIDSKHALNYEKFVDEVGFELDTKTINIYNTSTTFLDFFNRILVEICDNNYSKYTKHIKPWLSNFIKRVIFEYNYKYLDGNMLYKIDIDKLIYMDMIKYIRVSGHFSGGAKNRKYIKLYKYSLFDY
jgi:hypothetical protein